MKPVADSTSGFMVNYNLARDHPKLVLIKAAMNRQLQMVTEVGLSEQILRFFKCIQITIIAGKHTFAGQYIGKGDKHIELSAIFLLNGSKPALLHEFLHAYHDQRLPQSFRNRQIATFFERARQSGAYDAQSHMMTNVKEFFASTGTAYLFGVTELEPFTRKNVQKNQPVFYKYLQSLFGPDAGNYKGSLNERIEGLKGAKGEESSSEGYGE